jgi:hypothetical protein
LEQGPSPGFSATFEVIWVPWQDMRVLWCVMVIIVQSVRTPGCGPGGRGFESHWSPQRIADFSAKGGCASGAELSIANWRRVEVSSINFEIVISQFEIHIAPIV